MHQFHYFHGMLNPYTTHIKNQFLENLFSITTYRGRQTAKIHETMCVH